VKDHDEVQIDVEIGGKEDGDAGLWEVLAILSKDDCKDHHCD